MSKIDRYPAIIRMTNRWITGLFEVQSGVGDRYVPARPLPFIGGFRRFRAAWLVFTGQADALIWPKPEDEWNDFPRRRPMRLSGKQGGANERPPRYRDPFFSY